MANTTDEKALIVQGDELQISEQVDIRSMIHTIRGQQVMLDSDLALLYQVETKRLSEILIASILR